MKEKWTCPNSKCFYKPLRLLYTSSPFQKKNTLLIIIKLMKRNSLQHGDLWKYLLSNSLIYIYEDSRKAASKNSSHVYFKENKPCLRNSLNNAGFNTFINLAENSICFINCLYLKQIFLFYGLMNISVYWKRHRRI